MTTAIFERRYSHLQKLIAQRLAAAVKNVEPRDLAQGSRYVLSAKGKRIRPALVVLSCEAVGGHVKDALDAATAIEMLHDFTLVHDDVMDNAPSRRGRATVHVKWDVNHAILVGDVILGMAYRSLLQSKARNIRRAAELFTEGFIGVCEGQAFDMDFERRRAITMNEYYQMIGKKTGTLIATATELGAVLGNATALQAAALRTFGAHIGRAFQIQDDLLDVVADEKAFGKKTGSDIIEGKKTFLLVYAQQKSSGADRARLRRWMSRDKPLSHSGQQSLVKRVTAIYEHSGALEAAGRQIKTETAAGIRALHLLPESNARAMLEWMSRKLVQRTH
jgi:geranylgeranyl diphosphate synthase type II